MRNHRIYRGGRAASPILLDGLKKPEYRGYDSAGIAVVSRGGIKPAKTTGKVDKLIEKVNAEGNFDGVCGIGHTRWATHGVPNDINAHPHMSMDGRFAVGHKMG